MFDVLYRKCYLFVLTGICLCDDSMAYDASVEGELLFVMAATQPASSRQSAVINLIYQELFLRLGIPLRFVYLPLKRASQDANDGKIDGESGRIVQYGQIYTNMVRVEFPIAQVTISAFARRMDQMKLADGWDSLASTDHSIGFQRGIVTIENNLEKRVQPERLNSSTNIRQGLLKLKFKRTDLFVHSHGVVVDNFLSKEEFLDIEPVATMQMIKLYPYVHKKHQALVPAMVDTLKKMEEQGIFSKYCKQVYAEQADNHCIGEGNGYSRLQW